MRTATMPRSSPRPSSRPRSVPLRDYLAQQQRNRAAAAAARMRAAADSVERAESKKHKAEETGATIESKEAAEAAHRAHEASALRAQFERLERERHQFQRLVTGARSPYNFENSTAAYQQWAGSMELYLSGAYLKDVIATDPGSMLVLASQRSFADAVEGKVDMAYEKQKAVYSMLVLCVPAAVRGVLTTSLPPEQHSGYGAWRALRAFFIGDEQAYLAALEDKFQRVAWDSKESYPQFESRLESLLSEMQQAGVAKEEHVKKHALLRAIQQSHHRDVHGNHVFAALKTTAKIENGKPYRDWLTALRTEAQQIADAVAAKQAAGSGCAAHGGVKRKREDGEGEHTQQAGDANTVEQTAEAYALSNSLQQLSLQQQQQKGRGPRYPLTRASFDRQSHRSLTLCRNWSRTGQCSYGAACKFRHQGGAIGEQNKPQGGAFRLQQQQSGGRGQGAGGHARQGECHEFAATGKCSRQSGTCRYTHTASGGSANHQHGAGSGGRERESEVNATYQQEDAYMVQRAYALKPKGREEREAAAHRVLSDSGDSMHLTPKIGYIRNLRPLPVPVVIRGAFDKGIVCRLFGEGAVPLGGHTLHVEHLVYCPQLRDTLLSHVRLIKEGHEFTFGRKAATLTDKNKAFTVPVSYRGNILTLGDDGEREEEANVATTRSRAATPASTATQHSSAAHASEAAAASAQQARA